MALQQRREHALEILSQAGVGRGTAAPPLMRILWKLGADVPPPHFMRYWSLALLAGGFFGVAWGLLMAWFSSIDGRPHLGERPLIVSALIAGTLFGLGLATYYAASRRKLDLPAWDALA